MSTYRLDKLFAPATVAVVGASPRPGSLGGVVLKGLGQGGYKGGLFAINPKYGTVFGIPCHASLHDLPVPPDLVIVATSAAIVPAVIDDAGRAGAQTAIILSAGLGRGEMSPAAHVRQQARRTGLRIIGPNCLGVLSPAASLNASFASRLPGSGSLALVSQSGAIAAGMAEWAIQRDIGFSGIVSLGDAIDVDFGDCLDYFAEDTVTRSIILYIEAITDARKFMSAARKAARVKPVIIIKAGRQAQGAIAAATHTGALAGADGVYDAAFRRAGCLRVTDLDELLAIVGTLDIQQPFDGNRLAILTNGGGLGVLAVDRLADFEGRLAPIPEPALAAMGKVLPPTWSRANPVDIIGDAPPERYADALKILLAEQENDAVLVMNCPTALTSAAKSAEAVIATVKAHAENGGRKRPVFSVWLGADQHQMQMFEQAGIATYDTESKAVRSITNLMRMNAAAQALLRAPPQLPQPITPDHARAEGQIRAALADDRSWLTPVEVSDLLAAYGIPATPVRLAGDPDSAVRTAQEFLAGGLSCVVKIQSRDIVHKSDVDGVRLGLASPEAVRAAALDILARARKLRPEARIDGVTIQPMIYKPHARELIIGTAVDPTFGPIILFGHGGTAVEVINDKAMELLPLDLAQARDLIRTTRVARLLSGYRNIAAAKTDDIETMLVRVSRLMEDNPEVIGLDLNPVLVDELGAVALDARVQVARLSMDNRTRAAGRRFAIRPYPRELEQKMTLRKGREILVRPMRPTDARALAAMLEHCAPDDLRMRFFSAMRHADPGLIARLTQIDYAREMALVSIDPVCQDILGVVRLHGDANGKSAEFAIIVRSDQQGIGIGHDLMTRIIAFARAEDYLQITGAVMAENTRMLAMCRQLGFESHANVPGDSTTSVLLKLGTSA